MKEIGSEFWITEQCKDSKLQFGEDIKLFLSGRTALDFIIRDIKLTRKFNSVYVPSYSCSSMLKPFIDNNIKLEFYNVVTKDDGRFTYEIDFRKNVDAIILLQYFGYYDEQVGVISELFNKNDVIVIEDITHSLFQNKPCTNYGTYIFGSLRKWTCFYSGAFAKKNNGKFLLKEPSKTNLLFTELRQNAFDMKFRYMNDKLDSKDEFLSSFRKAENLLETDYLNYCIDNISLKRLLRLDVNYIKERRIKNANLILNSITNNKIKPIFNNVKVGDCPLFVPILVDASVRFKFKHYLIEKNIYCPIHWELSDIHNISDSAKVIYNEELSLICDQRYSEKDIKYLIDVINNFRV